MEQLLLELCEQCFPSRNDAKGNENRVTMLAQSIAEELKIHLQNIKTTMIYTPILNRSDTADCSPSY